MLIMLLLYSQALGPRCCSLAPPPVCIRQMIRQLSIEIANKQGRGQCPHCSIEMKFSVQKHRRRHSPPSSSSGVVQSRAPCAPRTCGVYLLIVATVYDLSSDKTPPQTNPQSGANPIEPMRMSHCVVWSRYYTLAASVQGLFERVHVRAEQQICYLRPFDRPCSKQTYRARQQ
jgi:hypothetical protein